MYSLQHQAAAGSISHHQATLRNRRVPNASSGKITFLNIICCPVASLLSVSGGTGRLVGTIVLIVLYNLPYNSNRD